MRYMGWSEEELKPLWYLFIVSTIFTVVNGLAHASTSLTVYVWLVFVGVFAMGITAITYIYLHQIQKQKK